MPFPPAQKLKLLMQNIDVFAVNGGHEDVVGDQSYNFQRILVLCNLTKKKKIKNN